MLTRSRFPGVRPSWPGTPAVGGLLLTAVLLAGTACGPRAGAVTVERPLVVFVQAPLGEAAPLGSAETFRNPYPSGSRVALWDPRRPGEPPRILTEGYDAAGAPSVSPDGDHILFCGRREKNDPWRIFEMPLLGGTAVPVSPEGANATGADYLSGGRIVFSSDLEGSQDPRDGGPAYSLYAAERDGSGVTRISFNPASEIDPSVLRDGRILYSTWQAPGERRAEGGWAFFTVRNDGTAGLPFYGSHQGPTWKRRPREAGRQVVFVTSGGAGEATRPQAVSFSRPLKSVKEIASGSTGSWRSLGPWGDDTLLASYRPDGGEGSFGLYRLALGEEGVLEKVLDDPKVEEIDGVLAVPRPEPRGIVSMVKAEQKTGELLCLDARRTDLAPPPGVTAASAVDLLVYAGVPISREEGIHKAGGSPPPGFPREIASRPIGTHPLAGDGSVLCEVPADTPLRFEIVDGEGRVILDSGGWVWVRPGERRGCIGCHEDRELAPPNRLPDVLRAIGEPRSPEGEEQVGAQR